MRPRKLFLLALVFAVLAVGLMAAPASAACTPGTLLCDRFGVELTLQPLPNVGGRAATTAGPYNGYAFNWASLAPTKNIATVDWKDGDWYGRWELNNIGFTSTYNRDVPATNRNVWDYWPSGDEPYDVEALYFDNDAENVYVAIVTSVAPYSYVGDGVQGWGVYERRPPFTLANGLWIPGSDLAISLLKGTPRTERYSSTWYYNYGLNIAHENRDAAFTNVGGFTSATARDYSLGTDFWKTNTDQAPVNQSNDNPAAGISDWFTAVGSGAAYAHGEHTSFDPLSTRNMTATPMQFRGNVPVLRYYEYQFAGGQLENDIPTYVIEAVIPRAFFGADNPKNGDPVGLRFTPTCRDDGNDNEDNENELVPGQDDPVLKLFGDFDDADWGDAPDGPYPTLNANNGANHILLNNGPFMGALVDAENDGQPNGTATGDDINPASADDEDGVTFVSSLIPTGSATINIDMTGSPAGTQCTLSSWIDFNADGDWTDTDDPLILTCPTCTSGSGTANPVLPQGQVHTLTFTVPTGAVQGQTYARFRCTTTGPLPPTGQAPNGEVEDYQVVVSPAPSRDWGDAPDSYGTLFSSSGPWHGLGGGGPVLGAIVDAEANGQPSVGATGDDVNPAGADDEDGVFLPGSITAGIPANMSVTVSTAACYLTGWIDFNVNGVFDSPAEQLNITSCTGCTSGVPGTAPLLPVGGTATLTFDVPVGAVPGSSYARFRCATATVNTPLGPATDGEVEDYAITMENAAVDWGDLPATAPSTAFPTLAAANGPRHVLSSNLYLGQCVDAEGDGVLSAQANGDDAATGTIPTGFPACQTAGEDEDGVTLVTPLIAGNQACVAVTAGNTTGGAANLYGWIDFDGNGVFDASEALTAGSGGTGGNFAGGVATIPNNYSGSNTFCFQVPSTATFYGGNAFMRFRLSTAGGLSWTGAASNGEVEDYAQPLACVGNYVWYDANANGIQNEAGTNGLNGVEVTLTWVGPNGSFGGGDDVTYTTFTATGGAVDGRYLFCGLMPSVTGAVVGTYRLDIPTPPYTLATTANAGGSDYLDSDGTQPGGSGTAVTSPAFTIAPVTGLPTAENGPGDQVGAGTTGIGLSGFPNNQDDMSIDFGFLKEANQDWGDLPNTFATLSANSGPNHALSANLLLGSCVDGEANGQPDAFAGMVNPNTGDDGNALGAPTSSLPVGVSCNDDEDGVTLVTPLVAGSQACVAVTAINTTGGAANLWGWIDFNGNGSFDATEALTGGAGGTGGNFAGGVATVPAGGVSAPNNTFCFLVPASATFEGGETHMRFRLTTDMLTTSSWVGAASNGEVEDYYTSLACLGNLVWQDTDKNGTQDTGESFLDTTVYMVWTGPDTTVQTGDGATTAAGDDVIYSVVTAAGKYRFCGVVPGTYQLKVVTPPLSYATTPNAGAATDFTDSDGVQSVVADSPTVIPAFSIVSITTLPTGENGLSDGTPINNFPDGQENRSYDFGFSSTPTAVTLSDLQATALSAWEQVLAFVRQLAQPAAR